MSGAADVYRATFHTGSIRKTHLDIWTTTVCCFMYVMLTLAEIIIKTVIEEVEFRLSCLFIYCSYKHPALKMHVCTIDQ